MRVDRDLSAVLPLSAAFHEESGGAFNVAVEPLMRVWGFHRPRASTQRQATVVTRTAVEAAARSKMLLVTGREPPGTHARVTRLRVGAWLVLALAAGCGHPRTPYVARVREAQGVLISVAAWGRDSARLDRAVGAALDSAASTEARLASLAARSGRATLPPAVLGLLGRALELGRASGGAYDPSGGGLRAVRLDSARSTLTLPPGARLEFGELGRGYALDRALAALRGAADSAVISSGGQYLVWADWSGARVIGIVDPDNTIDPLARVTIPAGTWAVSMLSVAEARDELLDPRTGKAATRTRVVAAMAPSAADAGGWSAAFYVVGCDSALALAPRVHTSVICVDAGVRWSADLEGRVALTDSLRKR